MVSGILRQSFGPAIVYNCQHFELYMFFHTEPMNMDQCRSDVVRACCSRDQECGVVHDAMLFCEESFREVQIEKVTIVYFGDYQYMHDGFGVFSDRYLRIVQSSRRW